MRRSPRVFLSLLALVAGPLSACKTSVSEATDAPTADASSRDGMAGRTDGAKHTADASADSRGRMDVTVVATPDAETLHDAGIPDVNRGEAPGPMADFCSLPGSVVWKGGVSSVVPGGATGANAPDLSWMKLPDGFCSHYYATVPETRQLRFSPSGDLFVASPNARAPGGASGGLGAIVVLPDTNHDGLADSTQTFLGNLGTTQALLFNGGYLYYQDGELIRRTPYENGALVGTVGTQVIDVNVYVSSDHWSKVLDADDDGNIYVTNGGDQGDVCDQAGTTATWPFHGGILKIDGTPNGTQVAKGLRNPYAIRCAKGTGECFGIELARDSFGEDLGSREKLFPIHQGDDWGFPCCATANLAYSDYTNPVPDCSGIATEDSSFIIDHTPFGLDFEEGSWPGTWQYRAFVVLHGYVGSWIGARVVAIATDPQTGWPVHASEADAGTAMQDFATGWDDGKLDHGRPAAVTFAPDGRMFVGNDIDGMIVWVAPVTASN